MNLGQIRGIEWDQRIAGEPARAEFVIEGIVAKLIVFDKIPDGIYAKAIDAALEPKTHHIVDGVANGRITPIQVWLCGEKRMAIILLSVRIEFPRASSKF